MSGALCGAEVMATLNYLIKPSCLQCALRVGLWSEGVPIRNLPIPQGAGQAPVGKPRHLPGLRCRSAFSREEWEEVVTCAPRFSFGGYKRATK